jgi:hypothetical protein
MSLAEGVQGTIVYKASASGATTPKLEDNAPGTSGGETLRRVPNTLNLANGAMAAVIAELGPFAYRHPPC